MGDGAVLRFDGMRSCTAERLARVLDNEREANSLRAMCTTFGFTGIRCVSPTGEAQWAMNNICRCPTTDPEECVCELR